MPIATYTSTVVKTGLPKFLHAGNVTVSGQAKWTAAGTVGDILQLAKIPHGAKIVDFYEYHTNGETAAGLSFGFDRGIAAGGGGNASCLVASGALATMNRMSLAAAPSNLPITLSLSDLDPVRYALLQAKAESGTVTTTVVVSFCLTYRFDGPNPV